MVYGTAGTEGGHKIEEGELWPAQWHLGRVAQLVGVMLFAGGRWQLALAMRQLEVAAAEAGGVPAADEGLP